nr:unnamed protein product [Callosobruchus chinensis]
MSALTHSEVHKKIIVKGSPARPKSDFIGPLNRYNDENHKIAHTKSEQFKETVRHLNRLNEETLNISKKRLQEDYRALLKCDFLEDDTGKEIPTANEKVPVCLRKRPEREIHEQVTEKQFICSTEPWFTRHLILNKFIQAARIVIVQNRLKKNLAKLKTLDELKVAEFEEMGFRHINISYSELFEKFLK